MNVTNTFYQILNITLDVVTVLMLGGIILIIFYAIYLITQDGTPRWDRLLFVSVGLALGGWALQVGPEYYMRSARIGIEATAPESERMRQALREIIPAPGEWPTSTAPTSAAQPTPTNMPDIVGHTVGTDETAADIAARYGLTIADLEALNGSLADLTPGQRLLIPGAAPTTSPTIQPTPTVMASPTVTPSPTVLPSPTAVPSPTPCIIYLDNNAIIDCPPTPQVFNGGQ